MSLTEEMTDLAKRARLASSRLASLSSDDKNKCLLAMADAIEANAPAIRQENARDLLAGAGTGFATPMPDRPPPDGGPPLPRPGCPPPLSPHLPRSRPRLPLPLP